MIKFPKQIGRRLVLIVVSITSIVIVLEILIAFTISSNVLRQSEEKQFRNSHTSILYSLITDMGNVEETAQSLLDVLSQRVNWIPGELRPSLNEFRRIYESYNISSINMMLDETSNRVTTYDYVIPDGITGDPTLPLLQLSDLPSEQFPAWLSECRRVICSEWVGPSDSLVSLTDSKVMIYVFSFHIERANNSSSVTVPNRLVWLEVPLDGFRQTVERSGLSSGVTAQGYGLVITEDNLVVANYNTDSDIVVLGESVSLFDFLPPAGQVTRKDDPLGLLKDSFVLVSAVPNTAWQFVTVIPNDLIFSLLPWTALIQLLLFTIVSLSVVAWIIERFIRREISDPLKELSQSARAIGSGNLHLEIPVLRTETEIATLAQSLDEMRRNLNFTYSELEKWSNTLEQRVRSRTRQLDIARREAQSSANEMRAIYDESLVVVSLDNMQEILSALTQRILIMLQASYAAVWLLEQDGVTARLVAHTESDKSRVGMLIDVNTGVVGQAIRTASVQVVNDYPKWQNQLSQESHSKMHQAMAAPLICAGEAIGAVIVGRTYGAPYFEVNDQRLLRLFANLVSPAVRNAQLIVQLDGAVNEAESANAVKTRFLASVTHELRTPLNLVINNMDFMRIGIFGEVTEEQIDRLDQTIRSAQHLLYLINDLLDVSKIEAGEMELFFQETELNTLLEDVIATVEVILEQYKRHDVVNFLVQIQDDLPIIPMDARRIRQVLVNLLSNAVKFTESGAITLQVTYDEAWLYVRVHDTGMGIPEHEIPLLFEVFTRATSAREKGIEGTGLGLPICDFLVKGHGGELVVHSEVGKGSMFGFTLPRQRAESQEPESIAMLGLLKNSKA